MTFRIAHILICFHSACRRVSLVIPNIQSISLYSQTLKQMIKLDMTVEMCR